MLTRRLVTLLFLMLPVVNSTWAYVKDVKDPACHPAPNDQIPQYIIGYGSLMSTTSKNKTDETSSENKPVKVDNYQRGWFVRGKSVSLSTTYLGVTKHQSSHFNGTIFQLARTDIIKKYDKREEYYCRVLVPSSLIHRLDKKKLSKGQFWIYEIKPEFKTYPSEKFPIVESYVDIFLSGCLELEKKFQLKNFASECVKTTIGWSPHWINDRIYPRRPLIFEKNATEIDKLLSILKPHLFKKIKLEA